jgi:hypothetical protein
MYVTFFLLLMGVTLVSYALLPEGILKGKHPLTSRLRFSTDRWTVMLQIFGYNLILTFLIMAANLIAQQSRFSRERFVPVGYVVFWVNTALFGIYVGTWSFGIATTPPPLGRRVLGMLDVTHRAGLLEFSAYLLGAATSFKFTLWYSDGRTIVESRRWRDVMLTATEKILLALAFVLLLVGAFVESRRVIQLG